MDADDNLATVENGSLSYCGLTETTYCVIVVLMRSRSCGGEQCYSEIVGVLRKVTTRLAAEWFLFFPPCLETQISGASLFFFFFSILDFALTTCLILRTVLVAFIA